MLPGVSGRPFRPVAGGCLTVLGIPDGNRSLTVAAR
jgi:hypothetical protein